MKKIFLIIALFFICFTNIYAANAKYIFFIVAEGMSVSNEIALSNFLYGKKNMLMWSSFPIQAYMTTWSISSYNGVYSKDNFDSNKGYNIEIAGTKPYPFFFTEDSETYFAPLHQVGESGPVDPFAGYNDLPFSPVGLENGAYWFNTEDYDIGFELVRAALSDDLNSIILVYDVNGTETIQRYTRGDDGADVVFRALHQVGEADPYARPEIPEGFEVEQLPEDATVKCGSANLYFRLQCARMGARGIQVQFQFQNKDMMILPENYADLKVFWEHLCNIYKSTIVLKKI